jgi:hypothetical protein
MGAAYSPAPSQIQGRCPRRKQFSNLSDICGREYYGGPVSCLHDSARPTTIVRFVVSHPVDTVDAGSRRTRSHVSEKALKRSPAIANRDASATIVFITGLARIATPAPHASPRLIRSICNVSVAMPAVCLGLPFTSVAAARPRVTRLQAVARHDNDAAAITLTPVQALPRLVGSYVLNHSESSKPRSLGKPSSPFTHASSYIT